MDFFTLVFIAIVLAALGSLAWWIFVIWLGVKVVQGVSGQLDAQLAELNRLVAQAQAMPRHQRSAVTGQIAARMMAAQGQLRELDGIHKARYEQRVSELGSMAAEAGISWTPPS